MADTNEVSAVFVHGILRGAVFYLPASPHLYP